MLAFQYPTIAWLKTSKPWFPFSALLRSVPAWLLLRFPSFFAFFLFFSSCFVFRTLCFSPFSLLSSHLYSPCSRFQVHELLTPYVSTYVGGGGGSLGGAITCVHTEHILFIICMCVMYMWAGSKSSVFLPSQPHNISYDLKKTGKISLFIENSATHN